MAKTIDFPQLALMRQGIDYRFPISCRKFEVSVRPLSSQEVVDATSAAADAFSKLTEEKQIGISLSLLSAKYQLERAATKDVGEQSDLPLSLLAMMTPDEVNHLWKQYVNIIDKVNPSFEEMSPQDLHETVEALKKLGRSLHLIDLSISKLVAVCLQLLKELHESRTDS